MLLRIAPVCVVLLVSCTSADDRRMSDVDPTADIESSVGVSPETDASPTAPSTTFVLTDEDAALVDVVVEAVATLLDGPAVEVTMKALEDGVQSASGTALIDNESGRVQSRQTLQAAASEIVTERVVIGSELFVRIYPSQTSNPEWTLLEVGAAEAQSYVDESYTAFGTVGASMERIVDLARNLPVAVVDRGPQTGGGLDANVIQLAFRAEDVGAYLRDNDLEIVGPIDPNGVTIYEFWVDGPLVRMAAAGTQFHDGEAIEGVSTRLDYQRHETVTIASPLP